MGNHNAVLITGNTYPNRRALRGAGCIFDYGEKGYIVSIENKRAAELAESLGLDVAPYEAEEDQLTPATGERLRKIRQDAIDRKRARLLDRAERAERRSDEAWNRISKQERDFLSLGEPVKIGHHSQRRHENLLGRVDRAFEESAREAKYAKELREKADWLMDARIKGDAAARRQKEREALTKKLSVGDLIDCLYGQSVILRIYKNSLRVKRERDGSVLTVDKCMCSFVEKREHIEATAPKFKKGDQVEGHYIGRWRRGVVLRRTPKGYSVQLESPNMRFTFSESDLRIAQD